MIIIIDSEKAFDKTTYILDNNSQQNRNSKKGSQIDKGHL